MEKYYIPQSVKEKTELLSLIHNIYPNKVCKNLYGRYRDSDRFPFFVIRESGYVAGTNYGGHNRIRVSRSQFLCEVLGTRYDPITPTRIDMTHKFI